MGVNGRNLKAVIEYDGTRYCGWQYQVEAPSVQATLERALHSLTGEEIRISASGRTDAGVHARGQVVSFRIMSELPILNITKGLNAHLPRDIAVREVSVAADDFHARYSARKRVYQYMVSTRRTALRRHFCWEMFQKFDPDDLHSTAARLLGEHDFGAFSRIEVSSKTKICTVVESAWRQEADLWIYRIAANRFLHGMVRTIVGTMLDVARGRFTKEEFIQIFESMDRRRAGAAAPACGLVLEEVVY